MQFLFNPVWHVITGGIVLLLPGLSWFAWFSENEANGGTIGDLCARLAEALGLSIAFSALVALVGFLLGWQLSSAWLLVLYGTLGFLVLLGFTVGVARSSDLDHRSRQNSASSSFHPGARNLLLLAVFITILVWRFYQVRELVLPAWVDSLHHVLITGVILETGGLPFTLDPYLPIPFYYHYAFHLVAALFSFWSGLPPEEAVLVIGQVLNAGVALAVYRLGISLWHDWRRAGVAALLVGFVSQMPAYYATWGRYTLLTGLVLLPLAMAVGLDLVHQGATRRRVIWLVLLTGGVLLSHYFAALLLAIFLLFLGGEAGVEEFRARVPWKKSTDGVRLTFWPLFGASVSGAVLASPWIVRVWTYSNNYVRIEAVLPVDSLDSLYFPNYLSYLWRMAGPERNYLLLGLGLLGLVTAAMRSKRRVIPMTVIVPRSARHPRWRSQKTAFLWWTIVLVLMSIPWGINLNPFRPDHAVIVLFFPAALLAADFLFVVGEGAMAGFPRLARLSLGAAVISLLAWGLRDTDSILNPATIFTSEADLRAMDWIMENTSEEARFFINVAPWQFGVFRGVDGGWWIPVLTNRQTLLPAVMYALGDRDYFKQIDSLAEQASQLEGCSAEFNALLHSAGLTHVYLVAGHGNLRAAALETCPYVSLLYQYQDVSIYQTDD